jgi:NADPH:quinone reductase-like Zn-dependent oxidoreductase
VRKYFIARYDSTHATTRDTHYMKILLILLCLFTSLAARADAYQQVLISEYGGPEVLQVVQQPALPEPAAGEVRIRVLTASASFTDVMVRKGLYPGVQLEPPFPPGYDMVGVVDKLGPGVDAFSVGQRVADLTVAGAYSEYMVIPQQRLVALRHGINDEEAVVLILSYTTAYQMMHRIAQAKPGQRILIHGASGAVGTALAQLGSMSGLSMYGTASTAKQDYVRSLGVIPIDYKTEDFVQRIQQLTNGQGVDVVFDAVGVDNFKRSYQTLNADGRLVTYGFYTATLHSDSMFDTGLEFLQWSWLKLWWSWFPEANKQVGFYSIQDYRADHPEHFNADLDALFGLLAEKNIAPVIYKTLPLPEAAKAHRMIESGEVIGKIVLRVSN